MLLKDAQTSTLKKTATVRRQIPLTQAALGGRTARIELRPAVQPVCFPYTAIAELVAVAVRSSLAVF